MTLEHSIETSNVVDKNKIREILRLDWAIYKCILHHLFMNAIKHGLKKSKIRIEF